MKLSRIKSFITYPKSPFHFDGTFHKPSHFPDKLSYWESGKYWQTIRVGKKIFGLKIEDIKQTGVVWHYTKSPRKKLKIINPISFHWTNPFKITTK